MTAIRKLLCRLFGHSKHSYTARTRCATCGLIYTKHCYRCHAELLSHPRCGS